MSCLPASFSNFGNVLVVSSSTRPTGSSLYEGRVIYETDTDRLLVWNGSAWIVMSGRVGARADRVTNQSISNNTVTSISFDSETADTDGFITPTSTTVTIPSGLDGVYAIFAHCVWASGPGTGCWSSIASSGTRLGAVANAGDTRSAVSITLPLAAGATISYQVYQISGGAINVTSASLYVYRIGP